MLSTQVARPLVEIFFGRLDARTVSHADDRASCWSATSRPPTSWSSRRGGEREWSQVAAELEAIYLRLVARRHDPTGNPRCGGGSPSGR